MKIWYAIAGTGRKRIRMDMNDAPTVRKAAFAVEKRTRMKPTHNFKPECILSKEQDGCTGIKAEVISSRR